MWAVRLCDQLEVAYRDAIADERAARALRWADGRAERAQKARVI